jgi:hypothetical protein
MTESVGFHAKDSQMPLAQGASRTATCSKPLAQ